MNYVLVINLFLIIHFFGKYSKMYRKLLLKLGFCKNQKWITKGHYDEIRKINYKIKLEIEPHKRITI